MKIIKSLVVTIILLCSVVNSQADRAAIPSGNIAWPTVRDTYLNPMTLELYNFLGANAGVLPATPTFSGLIVSGDGDSWLELENNTSFTDSLTGKYGIRFYNGVLQQILNGTATNIGSASIQELASDPTYTDLDTGEMAVSTSSGDLFIKTATGLYTIAGTYAADPTTPTLTSLTIPTSGDTATAVFSEAVSYGAGGAGGWTLNSPTNAMTYASGTGTDTIVFNLASTILSTDTPTVSYAQPTNGFESFDDGVDLASITNASVTNNSTQTGSAYTTAFSDDFNRADNTNVQTGSSWTSEIDTAGIGSILSNTYSIAMDGINTTRISKTVSANNTDYEIKFKAKLADITGVDTQGIPKSSGPIAIYSAAGLFLQIGFTTNAAGDVVSTSITRYNDAGSVQSAVVTPFTFIADTYVDFTIQVDVGEAMTSDGIIYVLANSTPIMNLTGLADETRPIVTEIRFGLPVKNWDQPNTLTLDDFVYEYK